MGDWGARSKSLFWTACTAGPLFAWVFSVFLSGTLFQGNDSVFSATFFTVSTAAFFLITLSCLLGFIDLKILIEKTSLFFRIGTVLLIIISAMAVLDFFRGMHGALAPVVFGGISGIGLACAALSILPDLTRFEFNRAALYLLASLAGGIALFLACMAFIPKEIIVGMLWVLPAAALILSLPAAGATRNAKGSFGAYARSLASSQMRGIFDHKAFTAFTVLSGFLFGYCYNVYPKTTRFAGAYTDAAFGSVSPAAVTFLVSCLLLTGLLLFIGKVAKEKSGYVFECILLVALAIMYFSLPNMPNNWMLFVLLDSAAVCTVLFSLSGAVLRCSSGDRIRFRRSLLFLAAGVLIGTIVAFAFIETTVPDPSILVPEPIRDAVIVGTPAIGFIALMMVFFVAAQHAFFPAPLDRQSSLTAPVDLAAASKTLSKRFALTPREEEILGMLLQGRSGPYISEDLYLSKSTVKTHIRHIYDKTGVSSRQQLIDLAHNAAAEERPSII